MGLFEDTRASVYEAHLDEASFMYEQRLRYLDDPTLTFEDVAALEARLEAHLDGLTLGGSQARQLCMRALAPGDPGSAYVALTTLCRQGEQTGLQDLLRELDVDDAEVLHAVTDALALELPNTLSTLAVEALATGRPALRPAWARAAARRRWPVGPQIIRAAQAGDRDTAVTCAWALGELGEETSRGWLRSCIGDDPQLSHVAALALAKLGEPLPPGANALQPWAAVPLAVADALRLAQPRPLSFTDTDPYVDHSVLALGLSGAASGFPVLIDNLADDTLGGAAATALYLMTGAWLIDEVVVTEPVDPELDDDLVDPEPSGEAEGADVIPVRPTTRAQISRDPARWRAFLEAHTDLVGAREPLRMGRPLGTLSTLAALQSLATPLAVRQLLIDDLRIRGRSSVRLQVDDPVHEQRAAWAAIGAAARAGQPFRFRRTTP
jgi:hypothetical protein